MSSATTRWISWKGGKTMATPPPQTTNAPRSRAFIRWPVLLACLFSLSPCLVPFRCASAFSACKRLVNSVTRCWSQPS